MFNSSPIYSARKSSNHKLSMNHKISHDTNLHKTKHTQTSDTIFDEKRKGEQEVEKQRLQYQLKKKKNPDDALNTVDTFLSLFAFLPLFSDKCSHQTGRAKSQFKTCPVCKLHK